MGNTVKTSMTKEEWLERCACAYEVGLTPLALDALRDACRILCWLASHRLDEVRDGGHSERDRRVLANDVVEKWAQKIALEHKERSNEKWTEADHRLPSWQAMYEAIELACVLSHPCTICATEPDAFHTLFRICRHGDDIAEHAAAGMVKRND